MGKLYIVATPIGNLKDITLRALEVLTDVDLILCEDTRVTRKLLSCYNIKTPLESYHQHSKLKKTTYILNLLKKGKKLALVSDSGTPGISDPGNELINFLIQRIPDLEIAPPLNISRASCGILFTLLDLEVGFSVCTSNKRQKEKIEEYFIINTGCRLETIKSADFILALGELPQLERIKRGSLEYPDQGATVIYSVEEINQSLLGVNSISLTLTGPGINGKRVLSLKGLKKQEVMKIIEVNKEFPLGVDFVFVGRKDKFFALPRSTKIVEVKEI